MSMTTQTQTDATEAVQQWLSGDEANTEAALALLEAEREEGTDEADLEAIMQDHLEDAMAGEVADWMRAACFFVVRSADMSAIIEWLETDESE